MLTIKPLLKHVYFNVNKHTLQIQTLLKAEPDCRQAALCQIYQIGVIRLHRFQSPSLSICLLSNCFHFVQTVLAVATNENCLLCSVQLLQPACNCLQSSSSSSPALRLSQGQKGMLFRYVASSQLCSCFCVHFSIVVQSCSKSTYILHLYCDL